MQREMGGAMRSLPGLPAGAFTPPFAPVVLDRALQLGLFFFFFRFLFRDFRRLARVCFFGVSQAHDAVPFSNYSAIVRAFPSTRGPAICPIPLPLAALHACPFPLSS